MAACRDEVVLTTKVFWRMGHGPNGRGGSRYHILRELDRSLRRLATDHVNVYLLHGRDYGTAFADTVATMLDVVHQGKARAWGMCNFVAWEACQALAIASRLGGPAPVCVQNPYSLLNRGLERDMLLFCREERLGVMAYSPMALGLLTGFYRPGRPAPPGSLWATGRRDLYETAFAGQALEELDVGEGIARAHERDGLPHGSPSPAHVALSWVLAHPEVTVAIVGCDTPAQVDANIGAAEWNLSADERAALDRVSASAALAVQ
ncbi:MAG: aldo/keto reductase [Actinobacteria bacterium]|nr:aldo/keto reductase [Actinomycetota bacterium]